MAEKINLSINSKCNVIQYGTKENTGEVNEIIMEVRNNNKASPHYVVRRINLMMLSQSCAFSM